MSASIEDPRQQVLELAQIAVSAGRPLKLRVVGDSMYPFLQAEDSIWVAPASTEDLKRGDLVVLSQGGELVTHRVVDRDPEGWRTKGDNRLSLDPPFREREFLGCVVAIERGGSRIDLQSQRWGLFNKLIGRLSWGEARLLIQASGWHVVFHGGFLRSSLRRIGGFVRVLLNLLRRALAFLVGLA